MKGDELMPTLENVTYEATNMGCFTDCGPVDWCSPDDSCSPDDK